MGKIFLCDLVRAVSIRSLNWTLAIAQGRFHVDMKSIPSNGQSPVKVLYRAEAGP